MSLDDYENNSVEDSDDANASDNDSDDADDDDADDDHDANDVYIYMYLLYIYISTYIHIMLIIMHIFSPKLAIFTYSTSNNPTEFCRVSSLPGGHLPMMPDARQI